MFYNIRWWATNNVKTNVPRSWVFNLTCASSALQQSSASEKWDLKKNRDSPHCHCSGHRDISSWFLWLGHGFPVRIWGPQAVPGLLLVVSAAPWLGQALGWGWEEKRKPAGRISRDSRPLTRASSPGPTAASITKHSPGHCSYQAESEIADSGFCWSLGWRDPPLELPVLPFSRISLLPFKIAFII